MSSKHTPGPWGWVVHDHSMASLGILPDPGLGDPLVLSLGPCRGCMARAEKSWEWGRCMTPSLQDARLIAAAPDLLEAAKAVEESLAQFRSEKSVDLSRLRAAIAKAEGQS